jgi:hypothetical protein
MGDQFAAILGRRIPRLNQDAAPVVADDIMLKMLENTESGISFGNEQYPSYSSAYAAYRASQNKPIDRVTLRLFDLALETVNVQFDGRGALISFVEKGEIFRAHHEGWGKLPERPIFPKRLEDIPRDTEELAYEAGRRVLSGKLA